MHKVFASLAGSSRARRGAGPGERRRVQGASLIVVMIIIVIVSILGISSARISLLGEYSARNDRDYQVAFQSAEAALHDAINDMEGIGTLAEAGKRNEIFVPGNKVEFVPGCGTSGKVKGLCAQETSEDPGAKPIWLQIDLASSTSPTTRFGEFTGSTFDAGSTGVRPAQAPRYMIEVIDDQFEIGTDLSASPVRNVLYRVTAVGFGPRPDSQAVVQMIYSKE